VGKNATKATKSPNSEWEIYGEKWFCSNADANLILITARYDEVISGTKGLGLFLVPAILENGERNKYSIRRLKEK
jgi:alkylation response protein AidB-like acyl-CoA dehydrogenase